MVSRLRNVLSVVLSAVLSASFVVALAPSAASAATPDSSSCLVINENDELISGTHCSGDVVIPASVKVVKTRAFVYFNGAVSFAANSQLRSVEPAAFFLGSGLRSIVFPKSLQSLSQYAVYLTPATAIYFEANPAQVARTSVYEKRPFTIVQARGALLLPTGESFTRGDPFQVDCNTLDGERDYLGAEFLALELHNCADPRNPATPNPPSLMGYMLNRDLNETVNLQSVDGSHRGSITLRQLGWHGRRLAFDQELGVPSFSKSVFGDDYPMPAGVQVTCSLANSTPLPPGVSLDSNCNLSASDTSYLTSTTTDITVDWTANNGVSNTFDVDSSVGSSNPVTAQQLPDVSGSVAIRVSLRNTSQLSAAQLFDMKLLNAKYSGASHDWNLALSAYRGLPSDQVPSGAPDTGISATNALEGFESGTVSEAVAKSVIDSFSSETPPDSSYLQELRVRLNLQSVTNRVATFETDGQRAQDVRQVILALPDSSAKDALYARFTAKTNRIFSQASTLTGGIRTITFNNPYEVESFTVPTGVSEMTIEIQGAEGSQGGFEGSNRAERAGYKGVVTGRLGVSPGQVLTVGVGEAAGSAPIPCLSGRISSGEDPAIARGGTNPLGGYAGGNGGTPGTRNCSGYGGAGGAATVVQVGTSGNPTGIATLVAGGSAGSGGASDGTDGPIGLSSFTARGDANLSTGQASESLGWYSFDYYPDSLDDGGGMGGGGGGLVGGATGGYNMGLVVCGRIDFCLFASSPGMNSTAGLATLTASYVRYTFDEFMNANGRVRISFVEPTSSPVTPGGSGEGSSVPSPVSTSPAGPSVTTSDAPTDVSVVPFWRGAEVSWSAPIQDGGSPLTGYAVTTSTGQTCKTDKLSCRIVGLEPGQLIEISVVARNSIGPSKPATPEGSKVFAPLSLNLWQTKVVAKRPVIKLMNPSQLLRLRSMLEKDAGGFTLQLRVAKNGSGFNTRILRSLLAREVRAISLQLSKNGLRSKVIVKAAIVAGNQKAHRPSVILISSKP
jgi:hypothetical protein